MAGPSYYGKYRGTVTGNVDPLRIARVQVAVPDVAEASPTGWAMPCLPVAGPQMGSYLVPPVGASVWVEFEQGDPDRPVWTGCFYGSAAEVPAVALAGDPTDPTMVVGTTGQYAIALSDIPGPAGGVRLTSPAGASIVVNDLGIFLSNGAGASVTLTGPTVSINDGALNVD